ncbi:uncharacterized protein KGF55_004697 [Candida pseudojiufengensis]|uniref:uncharacterized protein n=1 Tax=Candida pseudojiufengensis TaxID=497109 RepID=UPI00222554BB|nr:uncharacterized protein KGF55_004697 [Candida pseudojiufengensis]KAI5960405.1 hypothetical protein KGF55_004697 [Candida pseudojiufengensis]
MSKKFIKISNTKLNYLMNQDQFKKIIDNNSSSITPSSTISSTSTSTTTKPTSNSTKSNAQASANTTSSSIHSTKSTLRKKKSSNTLTPSNSQHSTNTSTTNNSNHVLNKKSSIADFIQGNANYRTSPENPSSYQETIFKIFTYIIILLPTLTSILFPINSNSIPKNEQIGNFIIDLLTVILISWVVRFTMEWPYNWMKKLQQTKSKLYIELKSINNLNNENADKIILLIRKIYTFEIIALICCLISSIFSSFLLIWTRKYTIIDQKRKKMIFNNVNIALLQFWSIFRIMITFIESLQNSSLNLNNSSIHLQNNSNGISNWLQDLKYYFLPNLTNQILLDHLQINNKQLDKLKLDLLKIKKELKSRDEYDELQQIQLIHQHQQQVEENIQLQQLLQQQQQQQQQLQQQQAQQQQQQLQQQQIKGNTIQQQISNYETLDPNQSISPFPLSLSPKEGSPVSSPTIEYSRSQLMQQQQHPQPLQLQKPMLPRRKSSFGKSPLKTIVEQEEDLVFESLETPSFTKFDNSLNSKFNDSNSSSLIGNNHNHNENYQTNSNNLNSISLSNIEFLSIIKKTIKNLQNEISIFDFIIHPNFVSKILYNEINSIFIQLKIHDFEILKFFILQIFEIYIMNLYVHIMDHVFDILNNPLLYLWKFILWGCFKIPIIGLKFYFNILFSIPLLILKLILIKPFKIGIFILQTIISILLRSTTSIMIKDKIKSSSFALNDYRDKLKQKLEKNNNEEEDQEEEEDEDEEEVNNSLKESNKIKNFKNLKQFQNPLINDQFTMKQFHLSPTLKLDNENDEEDEYDYFLNNNRSNNQNSFTKLNNQTNQLPQKKFKFKTNPIISVTPNSNNKFNNKNENYNFNNSNHIIYED